MGARPAVKQLHQRATALDVIRQGVVHGEYQETSRQVNSLEGSVGVSRYWDTGNWHQPAVREGYTSIIREINVVSIYYAKFPELKSIAPGNGYHTVGENPELSGSNRDLMFSIQLKPPILNQQMSNSQMQFPRKCRRIREACP